MRSMFHFVRSLWNLTGLSAAPLPRRLSNFYGAKVFSQLTQCFIVTDLKLRKLYLWPITLIIRYGALAFFLLLNPQAFKQEIELLVIWDTTVLTWRLWCTTIRCIGIFWRNDDIYILVWRLVSCILSKHSWPICLDNNNTDICHYFD